jgi:hypothetical protein
MSRAAFLSVVVAAALVVPIRAQSPPDLSGSWTLVQEPAAPTLGRAFAPGFTVTLGPSSITFDLSTERFSASYSPSQGGQRQAMGTTARRESYRLDGFETRHEIQLPPPRPGTTSIAIEESVSVAAWMGNKLVIVTHNVMANRRTDTAGVSEVSRSRQAVRRVFSLDANGALTVEMLIVADPAPTSFDRELPGPIKSVYRKVS